MPKNKGKGGKKGKTGAYATGAEVLEELAAQGHDLPARVLDWRQLSKLKSTYTDALVEDINPETGRIHTSYSMAGASTGRLSSNDPNLQNIPIRTEEGRKIRTAFVAPAGHVLLSVDYSQIELRIMAHLSKDEQLCRAFHEGIDVHRATAAEDPHGGCQPPLNLGNQISGFPDAKAAGDPHGRAPHRMPPDL
mgnify:CR=1 FL=1